MKLFFSSILLCLLLLPGVGSGQRRYSIFDEDYFRKQDFFKKEGFDLLRPFIDIPYWNTSPYTLFYFETAQQQQTKEICKFSVNLDDIYEKDTSEFSVSIERYSGGFIIEDLAIRFHQKRNMDGIPLEMISDTTRWKQYNYENHYRNVIVLNKKFIGNSREPAVKKYYFNETGRLDSISMLTGKEFALTHFYYNQKGLLDSVENQNLYINAETGKKFPDQKYKLEYKTYFSEFCFPKNILDSAKKYHRLGFKKENLKGTMEKKVILTALEMSENDNFYVVVQKDSAVAHFKGNYKYRIFDNISLTPHFFIDKYKRNILVKSWSLQFDNEKFNRLHFSRSIINNRTYKVEDGYSGLTFSANLKTKTIIMLKERVKIAYTIRR